MQRDSRAARQALIFAPSSERPLGPPASTADEHSRWLHRSSIILPAPRVSRSASTQHRHCFSFSAYRVAELFAIAATRWRYESAGILLYYAAAAVMFLILAALCYVFFRRAMNKQRTGATRRAWVYAVCGIVIVLSIVVLAVRLFSGGDAAGATSRIVFYWEATALVAFGVAWLAAGHVLPGITDSEEQWLRFPRPS